MSELKAPKKIFGPKKEDVREKFRVLLKTKLLFIQVNSGVRTVNCRRIRCPGHAVRLQFNSYRILLGKSLGETIVKR